MDFLPVLVLVRGLILLSAATEVLYVLPDDDSSTVNCPSQPCATLSQYFLDNNGTLPVVSNVEYHFLPGEHHLPTDLNLKGLNNFTLSGATSSGSLLTTVVSCCYQSVHLLTIAHSYKVKIVNTIFKRCNKSSNATHLLLYVSTSAILEDVVFLECGLQTYNLCGKSYVKGVSFKLHQPLPISTLTDFHRGIIIIYDKDFEYNTTAETILEISDSSITGKSNGGILLILHYDISIVLRSLQFYNMQKIAVQIFTESSAKILIEGCTFLLNQFRFSEHYDSLITITMKTLKSTITFLNCQFNQNSDWYSLIAVYPTTGYASTLSNVSCIITPTIILKGCDFIENSLRLLETDVAMDLPCMLNIIIIGPSAVISNTGSMHISGIFTVAKVSLTMIGPLQISNNSAFNIIICKYCHILFSKEIAFTANKCTNSIIFIFSEAAYIRVMEYSSIAFINNMFSKLNFVVVDLFNQGNPYIFCSFQYITPNNTTSVSIKHYNITFYKNVNLHNVGTKLQNSCKLDFHHFTSHCKWLPTSVFYSYNPGVINQQIIQTDQPNLHSNICYCSHNITNCSVDVLGPVYPGQVLQVDLCAPNGNEDSVLYVETHNARLSTLACMIAHQTELLQTISNYSRTFNFTVVTENEELCELFLTASPCLHNIYEAFYVLILPCPVGFTLQNGACDCDPYLSNNNIGTCYIDQSTITRPANSWIIVHNCSNYTKYLISHNCPMDYCLPLPSQLNLANPDLQCQFNRTGILCSQCQHGLSMVFGSSRCMKCTNIHILITLIVIVAGIVLVVLLYFLNLTVTNGTINGIIFYANIININDSVFLVNDNVFKPLRVFISFANLDLGVETCFNNGMDDYAKVFLQLFFPLYLIGIAISIIVASRYSPRIL